MGVTRTHPIRVFLVDDHRLVRAGVRGLLQGVTDIEVVGEAASGEEACRIVVELDPQVIVMDISLPGVTGIETIGRLLRILPEAAILVLTMHESGSYLRMALDRGARGYLSKRSAPQELVTAIRTVSAGRPYIERALVESMVASEGTEADPDALGRLGARDFEIFSLLARGRSVKEIGEILHLSPKTVHAHRAGLLHKLDVQNTAELAQLAARLGVVDPYGDSGN
jgi:two-component system, NarL family, invasion response regulator UvrY